ncbi:uncharacterized protein [Hoplias malabaricus]|uniref:uncharacterized protein n=1 Tax=Hoplias malabaricus TaxID=27720 RepID=UPI0034618E43
MSSGRYSPGRFERVGNAAYYDDFLPGSLKNNESIPSLTQQRSSDLALSSDPLPPPPLPFQPPVGPEFDPSESEDEEPAVDIKPVHRFIPDSWKNFFRGSNRSSKSSMPASNNYNTTTEGVRCSPPHSPSVPGSYQDKYGGSGGSYNSRKEREAMLLGDHLESVTGHTAHTAMTYSERVEEYHQRYSYMKSWPGLLRILGCIELLLGAAIFACVCAYVHKDNEWYNMFGYSQPQMYGGYTGGYAGDTYYTGPKTPFVLVVAGLAWISTVIMLVLGMTMYYRAILLDSNWWPLTEFIINLVLAVLYMAAGIVYVRDTTRGGLCYHPTFNNGIYAAFCRTEAGQTAAIIFLFVAMLVYLIGAIVCLKLWRHEAARRYREKYGHEMQTSEVPVQSLTMAGQMIPKPVLVSSAAPAEKQHTLAPTSSKPKQVKGPIPSGYIPKPVIVPDYLSKYPAIRSDEERDQYKAVFNDQYSEYKELHAEVNATQKKFDEMDSMMRNLPQHPSSQMESERINRILQEYQRKKNDPSFLEKKERCEYLKNKLAHIKHRIQEYDKVMTWNDGYALAILAYSIQLFVGGACLGVAKPPEKENAQHRDRQRRGIVTWRRKLSVHKQNTMSSKPNGSPPPYEYEGEYNVVPQPAYSYFAEDELQHFYRWSSPPGIIKIMTVISIIVCVGIFACVASTLAWDTSGGIAGFSGGYGAGGYGAGGYGGGYGGGFGSNYGGSYGGFGSGYSGFGYGVLGSQNDPRKAKGFIIAIAIITFAVLLGMFIALLSHRAQSRKFFLILIIVSAILALFMFIATIVYFVAINPMAQTSGSMQYNQVIALCAQYQDPSISSQLLVNQYLYHYCVVDPQEAVAVVFGFLVTICLVIIMVFAIKTRQKINMYGKENILWRREKVFEDPEPPQHVEDWVNNVSGAPEPGLSEYPEKFGGSQNYLDDNSSVYDKPPESLLGVEHILPVQKSAPYYSSSEAGSSASRPKKKRAGRPRRTDGKDYDTDYASSGDELDDQDFFSEYPPVANVEERESYKRQFDREHQEYKNLQAELDEINKRMAEVDSELNDLQEGTPQFLDALDEYNELKDKKKSADYQMKKRKCKHLKAKLNHIKRMVSDFDNRV